MIDMFRGLAMVLMALNHASYTASASILAESYAGVQPVLNGWPNVLTGLISNSAPIFFFTLAGTSVAFFERSRRKRGWTEWAITRFLLIRVVILVILDHAINRVAWHQTNGFWVLSAIAFGVAIVTFARLLSLRLVALLTAGAFLIYPLLLAIFPNPETVTSPSIITVFLHFNMSVPPWVEFPLLGWLGIIMLGYVWGRLLAEKKTTISSRLLWVALAGFAVWFVLRLLGGFGNVLPYHSDWPLVYFFVASKQPPSLVYLIFNLSYALLLLVAIKQMENWLNNNFIGWVLQVFGQTSLFFYLAHLVLYCRIIGPAISPDTFLPNADLLRAYLEFALGIVILIPACAIYRQLRQRYAILSYL